MTFEELLAALKRYHVVLEDRGGSIFYESAGIPGWVHIDNAIQTHEKRLVAWLRERNADVNVR